MTRMRGDAMLSSLLIERRWAKVYTFSWRRASVSERRQGWLALARG
jgi:hypothetical protein